MLSIFQIFGYFFTQKQNLLSFAELYQVKLSQDVCIKVQDLEARQLLHLSFIGSPKVKLFESKLLAGIVKQGFSTFWYPRTPKSQLYLSVYPKIRIVCPLRTPKSKILPKRASFEWVFKCCVPNVTLSRTTRGTRTPG